MGKNKEFKYSTIKPKTVVHCDTEEKAKTLLEWADSRGYKWKDGDSFLNGTMWEVRESDTCYSLYEGTYYPYDHCKEKRFTVIEYEDALKEPEEIPFNPEDMNIVVLTDEHLQKIITEAVKGGIKEYKENEWKERLITDCGKRLGLKEKE